MCIKSLVSCITFISLANLPCLAFHIYISITPFKEFSMPSAFWDVGRGNLRGFGKPFFFFFTSRSAHSACTVGPKIALCFPRLSVCPSALIMCAIYYIILYYATAVYSCLWRFAGQATANEVVVCCLDGVGWKRTTKLLSQHFRCTAFDCLVSAGCLL